MIQTVSLFGKLAYHLDPETANLVGDRPVTPGDIAVLVILILSALLAFARGFVREVLSIAAWIGAAAVTLLGLPLARDYARDHIESPLFADLAAGLTLFLVSLILLSVLAHYISQAVRGSAVNAVDRSLGFLFGLVRGAVLVCLAYLLLTWLMPPPEHPTWVREARALPLVVRGSDWLLDLVPERAVADTLDERVGPPAGDAASPERLEELSVPQPRAGDAPGAEPDYRQDARERLNHLIQSTE